MKNIKDIILSIFAVIGFVTLLSSFTNNEESVQINPVGQYQLSCVAEESEFSSPYNNIICARINTRNGNIDYRPKY